MHLVTHSLTQSTVTEGLLDKALSWGGGSDTQTTLRSNTLAEWDCSIHAETLRGWQDEISPPSTCPACMAVDGSAHGSPSIPP